MMATRKCDTHWGPHGCHLPVGHNEHHFCCCDCKNHPDPESGCVGAFPYYGAQTQFHGDDAPPPNETLA